MPYTFPSSTFHHFSDTFFLSVPPSFPHHSWGSAVAIGDSTPYPQVVYCGAGKGHDPVLSTAHPEGTKH